MKAALSAAGVLAGGGGGAVTALTLADAPWGVITAVVVIAMVCSTVVYLVQAVLPQDSPDRLNFWLELLRHRAARQAHPRP